MFSSDAMVCNYDNDKCNNKIFSVSKCHFMHAYMHVLLAIVSITRYQSLKLGKHFCLYSGNTTAIICYAGNLDCQLQWECI